MLKDGVPVVFAYIADAHDNQEGSSLSSEHTFGPGEAPYVKRSPTTTLPSAPSSSTSGKPALTRAIRCSSFAPDEAITSSDQRRSRRTATGED